MTFATTEDNQTTAIVRFYEGERNRTKHNNLLAVLEVKDLPPAPRGVSTIVVTIEISVNHQITVSCSEPINGREMLHVLNHHTLSWDWAHEYADHSRYALSVVEHDMPQQCQ